MDDALGAGLIDLAMLFAAPGQERELPRRESLPIAAVSRMSRRLHTS